MTVLIAHPSPPVLEGLVGAVGTQLETTDLVTASTVERCVAMASAHHPDLAIVDVDLDLGQEVALCRSLHEADVPPLMLTRRDALNHLELLEAGAKGLALPDDGLDGLFAAISAVLAGHAYVPPQLLGIVLHGLIVQRRRSEAATNSIDLLTPRERDVLGLVRAGAGDREIAMKLAISPNTAKTHIHRVLQKLGARTRTEAAALAAFHGIPPAGQEVTR